MKYWIILLALLTLVSCQKKNSSPESTLKRYMELRYSSEKLSREDFLKLTTGKLAAQIVALTPSELESFLDFSKYKNQQYKLINSSCQGNSTKGTCYLTYSVSYDTFGQNKKRYHSEIKKLAELVDEEGDWKIASVENIKTYHESTEVLE